MEHDAAREVVAELLAQPSQVPGVRFGGRGGRLDLERDDPTVWGFGNEVDLVAPIVVAKVVEPRGRRAEIELGAELGDDERIDETAKHIAVAYRRASVDTEQRADEIGRASCRERVYSSV